MIYGYLRVSTDDQDIKSQKQGVDSFAKERGWNIDEYISDEGVSGGKNPDKRNLGPLLKKLNQGDIIIASEISRLGRDLYMVMDILHFCMERQCFIYTVKDKFTLGDDIQSKVLAFAFGLSAEIERQMIRQRTKEGLRLRMKMGILLGRPRGAKTRPDLRPCEKHREQLLTRFNYGVPLRRLAKDFGIDRGTIARWLVENGAYDGDESKELRVAKLQQEKEKNRARIDANRKPIYKDTPYLVVPIDEVKAVKLIEDDLTLPQIAEQFPEYSYEQVYDTILSSSTLNPLYRKHGQLRIKKKTQ